MQELSNYQKAIIAAATDTQDDLLVKARAGSGKTFTVKKVARALPDSLRILFMAFNKHIADVLKKDLPFNVTASTFNAFGWQICRSNIKGLSYKVDAYKTDGIYKTFFNMEDAADRKEYYRTKGSVSRLVSLFKAHIMRDATPDDVMRFADEYTIEIGDQVEVHRLIQVYRKCLSFQKIMDFDDQVFMPIYLDLPIPQYDVAIIDEGQDMNPLRQEIAIRAGKRRIIVGDDKQAIYGFTGADTRSMQTMKDRLNATELPLSICYRCPKKVVELAQQIVPDIEWAPDAEDGVVEDIKYENFESQAVDGDYVLCRTTAPLVSTCLKFIREGRKASVRGRDIGQQLLNLVTRISPSDYEPIEIFRDKLNAYRHEQLERLERAEREVEIIALNDRIDTIMVLVERCKSVGDIKTEVDQIFKDERTLADGTVIKIPGVVFCTVHKAKGLEADNIYILKRELMPHKSAKKPHQIEQEMNLKYVAITRALKTLRWVIEK